MVIDGRYIGTVSTKYIKYSDKVGLVMRVSAEYLDNDFTIYIPASWIKNAVRASNGTLFSVCKDLSTWEEIIERFPGIDKYLVDLFARFLDIKDELANLNTKFPVKGYSWSIDPNHPFDCEFRENKSLDYVGITLTSNEQTKNEYALSNYIISKQINCAEGNHDWQNVGGVKWCRFCGSIAYNKYVLKDGFVSTIQEILIPESPHYLNKDDPKDKEE